MSRSPSSPPPVPPLDATPCDAYVDALLCRVDRERPPLPDTALDAHLASCARCRRRAREMEGVSRALKAWDAQVGSRVGAPERLRLRVRGAVADVARRRRRERHRVRLSRAAMAASVLLAFGAALLAGLQGRASVRAGPATARAPGVAAPLPPLPEPRPIVVLDAAPPLDLGPSALAALPPPPTTPLPRLVGDDAAALGAVLARLELAERDRRAVEGIAGHGAVAWADPVDWAHPERRRYRWVGFEALAYVQDLTGAGSIEGWLRGLRERQRPGHVYAGTLVADTGRRARDVAGVTEAVVVADAARRANAQADARGRGQALGKDLVLHVVDVGPGAGYAPRGVGTVLDLAEAHAEGRVRLEEGSDDDLVVIARALRHPVYVPAGELIAGGSVDRVVARPLWIPARPGVEHHVLACRPVSSPRPRATEALRPIGQIAGPDLRRLLEDGGDREAVLGFVLERTRDQTGDRYSLLELYGGPELRDAALTNGGWMRREGVRAFALLDREGRFVGYEASLLPREAASRLLGRLVAGYGVDAHWRASVRPSRAGAASAAEVLRRLVDDVGSLKAPREAGAAVRVARLLEPTTRLRVTTVEEAATGRALHASVLR